MFSSREAAGGQTRYLEAPKISKKHYYIAFFIFSSLDSITCIDKNKTQLFKFQELIPGKRTHRRPAPTWTGNWRASMIL